MGQSEGMEVVVMEVEDEEERESESEELKWENFMPRMVLRVLLVEADDSTRHIIGALLRKCNYKVAAFSDGLKAWEILKRRHSNIDLILTELDLPSISGYALLTLIMEHNDCKDIPVIIMSSQDSISMVLKCILKGAADFLVKPVRKNELKNLWRHAWRKFANNAGHNPQNLTAEQCRIEATYENNTATNDSGDDVSSSKKSCKSNEKATNAQGLSQMKCKEGTGLCCREEKHQINIVKEEEDLFLHNSLTADKTEKNGSAGQPSKQVNVSTSLRVDEDGTCSGVATDARNDVPENHLDRVNIVGHELPDPSNEAVDLIGRINKQKGTPGQGSSTGEFNSFTPELELSLKRPLDSETREVHERHILNHSSASAFSRYSSNKKPRTFYPLLDVEHPKVKVVADSPPWPKPLSSDKENKLNILAPQSAHCDQASPHHQFGLVPLPGFSFDSSVWPNYGAMFQPIYNPRSESTERSLNLDLQREKSPLLTGPSVHSDLGSHSSPQGRGQPGDELKIRESIKQNGCSSSHDVDPSGSSSHCNDFARQHTINTHGSASEITDVNPNASGTEGSNLVEESEACKPVIHDQLRKTMGLHSAEREAALAKFREKRKGRCFEKKVRYQSRKRLAEARPRVKGQFVRQVPIDHALADVKP